MSWWGNRRLLVSRSAVHRRAVFGWVVAAALLALASPSAGALVEIPPLRDTTVFDLVADTLSSNGAGPYFFAGKNSQGNTRRALLAFSVADSIPSGAEIRAVELRVTVSQTQGEAPRTVAVHRLLAGWGEGSSFSSAGAGATPAPGDATWIHRFFPDQLWSTPGGDIATPASATLAVTGTGLYTWAGAELVADVQQWIDQPDTNHGWLLTGDETVSATVKRFDSRENPQVSSRPVLVVTYDPPVPVHQTSWGRVKWSGRPR